MALCNATFPYVLRLANAGWEEACQADPGLAEGLNIIRGNVTHRAIAEATGVQYHPVLYSVNR